MKSIQKPLFWGLVALLICLACCALLLAGYVFWMPQKVVNDGPYIVYDYPTEISTPDIKATSTVLSIDVKRYVQLGDYDKAIELLNRQIAFDPDNPDLYFERAHAYRKSSDRKTNLNDSMDLLNRAIADADKGISLDPKNGDLYMERGFSFLQMTSGYRYQIDRDYLYQLAIENLEVASSLRTKTAQFPERYLVMYYAFHRACERAMSETQRLASINSSDGFNSPTIESLFDVSYACLGDYDNALKYYLLNSKKKNGEETDKEYASTAHYLYLTGKADEAYELLNQSIEKKPNYYGGRYFLRAVIEFDRGEYDAALQDAYLAESNSWALGTISSYIEGLNDARLGNKEKAIEELQYAEATMNVEFYFAIEKAREELKKLNAAPLEITPSVNFNATPLPVFPTADLKK
ncbi:MAG: tetratricopeptide repeat protein, partial [Anaerolineae bacterium]|nr:tetratricopeptide repeat protein [Anaerolineae bacterium]